MNGGLLSILQSWVESTGGGTTVLLEQSMSAEGAFWFPDLLAPDPIHILPVFLSVTLFTSITWGWKVPSHEEMRRMSVMEYYRQLSMKFLKRTLQVIACSLAFAQNDEVCANTGSMHEEGSWDSQSESAEIKAIISEHTLSRI